MSTFFRALERAEQERGLRRAQESSPEPTGDEKTVVSLSATPAAPVTDSAFRQPKDADSPLAERAHGLEAHLVSLIAPTSFEAEQYRALRHMIEQLRRSAALSVIAISSPDAGDGKTTTTINLAGALAQASDARVLVVDADLRGCNVATDLGIAEAPGLVDLILRSDLALEAAVQVRPHLNLSVLTAGRHSSTPYEALKSPRVGELLVEARRKYDYVIVDTAPLVSVPDSRVLEKWVDGFLIVVGAHRTPRRLVEEALSLIAPNKILGMIFNGDDRHLSRYSYESRRGRVSRARTRIGRTVSNS
jgi:capsular exopolysaccharide synthesis family protein